MSGVMLAYKPKVLNIRDTVSGLVQACELVPSQTPCMAGEECLLTGICIDWGTSTVDPVPCPI